MKTCDYKIEDVATCEPTLFYKVDNFYYMEKEVKLTCNINSLPVCCEMVPSSDCSYNFPIKIHRHVFKKYYFLLPPEAVGKFFCVRGSPIKDTKTCYSEDEWRSVKAERVAASVYPKNISVGNSSIIIKHGGKEIYLNAPDYRPWDYWIKKPVSYVLLVGVDVPCTIAFSTLEFLVLQFFK